MSPAEEPPPERSGRDPFGDFTNPTENTMTDTDTTIPPAPDSIWCERFAAIEARFPKVRDGILAAMNILTQDPNISIDDAKAQAAAIGFRITAASISAAQRLIEKQTPPVSTQTAKAAPTCTNDDLPDQRPARRVRAPDAAVDAEALIRQVVTKIQGQGNAEVERMREAVRRAIAMLEAAVRI